MAWEGEQGIMQELSIFDFLPKEEAERFRPKKSTDWKWTFADYPKEKNGLNVFSCFACGGGSTMGYKLAGCDVVGCCEIDPRMNDVYVKNHNPRHNFLMDIRKFNAIPNEELPPELFDLDILDGSPPCTTFSMAGEREESWGKKKRFREGQAEQTLDDLSFVFIDTVAKLQPKCAIMENVKGLLLGDAWSYVQEIYRQFKAAGYSVKHWLCKGENMGVPQQRHRAIFIALRSDNPYNIADLDMSFNYEPVLFGEAKEGIGYNIKGRLHHLLSLALPHEKDMGEVTLRVEGKTSCFNQKIIHDDEVMRTIPAGHNCLWRFTEKTKISKQDIINCSTFPRDYDFIQNTFANVSYICGMSVPPIMIKRIVQRMIESGVFAYKGVL
jgi:DNA (cytosine-5)-methyltransferase 1